MILPDSQNAVLFVYLSDDRLYTQAKSTLLVYSVNDLSSPLATYPLSENCISAIISDTRLFLEGDSKLHVYEVTTSLTEPLTPLKVI